MARVLPSQMMMILLYAKKNFLYFKFTRYMKIGQTSRTLTILCYLTVFKVSDIEKGIPFSIVSKQVLPCKILNVHEVVTHFI